MIMGLPDLTVDLRPGPLPPARMDAIWAFHLRPAPGGRTRLVIRKRGRGPRLFTWPVDLLYDPVHFIMQTRQFHNLWPEQCHGTARVRVRRSCQRTAAIGVGMLNGCAGVTALKLRRMP
jgi:hypothetical protein